MTVKKIINIAVDTELKILGATLPSTKDAIPRRLRVYDSWWWLQSPSYSWDYAVSVNCRGSINHRGNYVNINIGCVRPALIINLESSNFKKGDCFYFKDKEFEIVSENLAFCKTDIGYHRFDKIANIYEDSEIKEYINNWFEN